MYTNSLQSLTAYAGCFLLSHKWQKIFTERQAKRVFTKQTTKRILRQIGGEYSGLVYRYDT